MTPSNFSTFPVVTPLEDEHWNGAGVWHLASGTRELARHRMTDRKTLLTRLAATKLDSSLGRAVRGRIERDHPMKRQG